MTAAAKLTSKGQITVPKVIREDLGLTVGDEIEFVKKGGEFSIRRAATSENPFLKFQGMLKGSFKSRKEINAWISEMRDAN